jgi:POT family proton-dependent oligopeptide transporter
MFIAVPAFLSAAMIQGWIEAGEKPHIAWQAIQYLIIAIAETLVSVTALEFAYSEAPKSMKSTIMSLWFLTFSLGNLFTGIVAKAAPFSGAAFFWFFSGLTLVAAIIFAIIAKRYRSTMRPTEELPANAAHAS